MSRPDSQCLKDDAGIDVDVAKQQVRHGVFDLEHPEQQRGRRNGSGSSAVGIDACSLQGLLDTWG